MHPCVWSQPAVMLFSLKTRIQTPKSSINHIAKERKSCTAQYVHGVLLNRHFLFFMIGEVYPGRRKPWCGYCPPDVANPRIELDKLQLLAKDENWIELDFSIRSELHTMIIPGTWLILMNQIPDKDVHFHTCRYDHAIQRRNQRVEKGGVMMLSNHFVDRARVSIIVHLFDINRLLKRASTHVHSTQSSPRETDQDSSWRRRGSPPPQIPACMHGYHDWFPHVFLENIHGIHWH